MKRKKTSVIAMILLILMTFSLNVLANSGSDSVTVGKKGVMNTGVIGAIRSGNYSYASVKADSVYPTGTYSKDNFTKCKTRLYKNDSTSTAISKEYTLTEGAGYEKIYIYEGKLALKKFNICFAGNNKDYSAVIDFHYNAN